MTTERHIAAVSARSCLLALALGAASCHLVTPFDVSAPRDGGADSAEDGDLDSGSDGSSDGDVTTDADGAVDSDVEMGSGPVVIVATRLAFTDERTCDVDGDGTPDNAFAELGVEGAELFIMAVNVLLAEAAASDFHPIFHFRRIDELGPPSDPGTSLATYVGVDMDDPADESDDFSGEEPFYADALGLDGCGEPKNIVDGVRIDEGTFTLRAGTFALALSDGTAGLIVAEATGQLTPGGASLELRICGYVPIADFGNANARIGDVVVQSALEIVLAGGQQFGISGVPGLTPDVDLDGDGLEWFELDSEGAILRCIDGDLTLIEGRECWRDPRIADAFSLTLDVEGVGARFGGRRPGWEYQIPVGCDPWPVEDGFFSTITATETACVEVDELCDPLQPSPCCDATHRCSGADDDTYRCYPPCEPSGCLHGGGRLGACIDLDFHTEPLCWDVGNDYEDSGCTPGTTGCTTQHGISEGTICIDRGGRNTCAEVCTTPTVDCGVGHFCVPLPFESGGVCSLY